MVTKKPKKKSKKLLWTSLIIFTPILIFIVYYVSSLVSLGQDLNKDKGESAFGDLGNDENGDPIYSPPEWEGNERVNILLLGGDTRGLSENEVPRSDTMMVMSLDPETNQAFLFSILRDSYVDIPGYWGTKINAALVFGGPNLAMETVSNFTGLPIQYYVYVDFEGFTELVDAIGGVEFYVEKDMYYTSRADGPEFDINLKEGLQHLDGKKALQYVRYRYDVQSDFGRTERQRNLLKAVADEMLTFSNLITLPNTLEEIEPYIETNLTVSEMVKLGSLAYKHKDNGFQSEQLPPPDLVRDEIIDNISYLTADEIQMKQYIQDLFEQATLEDKAEVPQENEETTNIESSQAGSE
ncbi:LCP family protein [Chengkuizengella axinellae]|uniref:LCP family protein n=1 Tax=Chengkuizengella axinellae TaxID=3064388 RepID=A0ABT9J1K4_9BACL|nr:LCP family protein [Chengkuizengella sp. 2205SS18-9]MDP5274889.1 LCP family protein [Chengkuizengella sp. 2205SS18-9]